MTATIEELQKARNWIGRWKKAGGSFKISLGLQGVHVQLTRAVGENEQDESERAMRASALEMELLANPNTQLLVSSLARDAWESKNKGPSPDTDSPAEPSQLDTWRTAPFEQIVATYAPDFIVEGVAFAENLGPYPVVKIGGLWYDGAMPGDERCVMPVTHAISFDPEASGDLRP